MIFCLQESKIGMYIIDETQVMITVNAIETLNKKLH